MIISPPVLVLCLLRGGDRKRRGRLVVLARSTGLPGRSSIIPSPVAARASATRASNSFGGSSPFMPRETLAAMRGNCSWRSRPRRRSSQSLATARLARVGRCDLSSHDRCAVSRCTLPFLPAKNARFLEVGYLRRFRRFFPKNSELIQESSHLAVSHCGRGPSRKKEEDYTRRFRRFLSIKKGNNPRDLAGSSLRSSLLPSRRGAPHFALRTAVLGERLQCSTALYRPSSAPPTYARNLVSPP